MDSRIIFSVFVAVVIASCAGPAPDFSRISVGMSKNQVISQLGRPDSFSANGGTEKLVYGKWDDSAVDGRIGGGRYFVLLKNGQVQGYGKFGDEAVSLSENSRRTENMPLVLGMLPPVPNNPVQYSPPPAAPYISPVPRTRTFNVERRDSNTIEIRERPRFY
jgi:hypothetical protein